MRSTNKKITVTYLGYDNGKLDADDQEYIHKNCEGISL